MPEPSAFDASFPNLPADTRNRGRPPVLDTASAAYVHDKTLVRGRNGAIGSCRALAVSMSRSTSLRPCSSLAYRSREDVCRYVPFEPMSRDDIIERIAGQWARTELTDEGQSLTLGAQVGETSEPVGDVVLFWRSRACWRGTRLRVPGRARRRH